MTVTNISHPKFNSNSWVIEKNSNVVIIDCNQFTDEYLIKNNLQLNAIILTHEHFDHIESLNELRVKYKVPVYGSIDTSSGITDGRVNLSLYYYGDEYKCNPLDFIVNHNDYIMINDIDFQFFISKGHSDGSILIYSGGCLFTGDTLLNGMKIETKLPTGDKSKLQKSLKFIYDNFDEETKIYPGHFNSYYLTKEIINLTLSNSKLKMII